MNPPGPSRRSLLGFAGLATASLALPEAATQAQETARRGRPPLKITDVRTILTQPDGEHLVVVKVLTNEPGLHGIGCATHGERPLAVAAAIDQHVKGLLIGKECDRIEDIWQTSYVASYFRSGATLNNALSGIDGALWDILGKQCGVPVHKLLGGKVREAVPLYAHAAPRNFPRLRTRYVGGKPTATATSGCSSPSPGTRRTAHPARPRRTCSSAAGGCPALACLRAHSIRQQHDQDVRVPAAKLGFGVELIHDVHERIPPVQAIQLAKALEPFRLFFLEDCFAPEDAAWFQHLRSQTSTPLAMGELFVNRHEWLPLVTNRWIDFIRLHISAVGGLSMARKVAACCEFFNVRTAWHGPGNVSPVGHAVNLHLNLASYNFGIQEQHVFSDTLRELFPGAPEIKKGYMYSNDKPGLGIDVDEKIAAKFPYTSPGRNRGTDRRLDGTIVRP